MREPGRSRVSWMGVIGLVTFGAVWLALPRRGPASGAVFVPHVPVVAGASAFERALAVAREGRMQAREAVRRAMEEREARDPVGAAALDGEAWRRGLLATDRNGWLRRALRSARQASALARDRGEACRAAELRVMLECEAGHHREELRQAKRLVALEHRSGHSLSILLRAAGCNERRPLAHRIAAEMDAARR
jgi:hypothetical protein